jgi:hypothetical protein
MHIYPFPDDFWERRTVRMIEPTPAYVGPMPRGDQDMFAIVRGASARAYVYVVMSDLLEVLYVGKSVNPVGRFSSHRCHKWWWPTSGRLVLLGVDGVDRRHAEAAALHLERLAIRSLNPLYNVAGVLVS